MSKIPVPGRKVGRKTVLNAARFPHPCDLRNDKRFKLAYSKLKRLGPEYIEVSIYGTILMLFENLGQSNNRLIQFTKLELELLAEDCKISFQFLCDIIDEGTECGIFNKHLGEGKKMNDYTLTSPIVDELLKGLAYKREYQRQKYHVEKGHIPAVEIPEDKPAKKAPSPKKTPVGKYVQKDMFDDSPEPKKHSLQIWIEEHCKYVSKMPHQLSYRNCVTIQQKYDPHLVAGIFKGMNNHKSIEKNKFVYDTFKTWVKNNQKWSSGDKEFTTPEGAKYEPMTKK